MTSTNRARAAVAATTEAAAAGTDVAEVGVFQPRASVANFIERMRPEIANALPRHMDVDRVMRLALTVVRQSEIQARKTGGKSLSECTPDSFAGALLTASALGLEPGINGEAYLVPYKGECTLIIGYQGFAKLFWQHPMAKHLDAHAVHQNDAFDYGYGLAQFLRHKPAKGERGPITHYYAVAELSTGASSFVVLTKEEVKELRGKEGPSGNIPDPQHWMERKTVLRQLVKLLPKSANLGAAIAADEQPGSALRDMPEQIATTVTRLSDPSEFDEAPPANVNTATGEVTEPAVVTPAAGPVEPDQSYFDELNAGL
jgi:recombination protein RecT